MCECYVSCYSYFLCDFQPKCQLQNSHGCFIFYVYFYCFLPYLVNDFSKKLAFIFPLLYCFVRFVDSVSVSNTPCPMVLPFLSKPISYHTIRSSHCAEYITSQI